MPWVEIQERHKEIESDGAEGAHNQVGQDVVTKSVGVIRINRLQSVLSELFDHNIERRECSIGHDDRVHNHCSEE